MKQHCEEPPDLIEQICQAADQNNYQNYRQSTSHKMINLEGGFQGEDFQEAEDFQEVEDFPVEEDTQAEEEYHLEDHQEGAGDRHHYPCHKSIKGN